MQQGQQTDQPMLAVVSVTIRGCLNHHNLQSVSFSTGLSDQHTN